MEDDGTRPRQVADIEQKLRRRAEQYDVSVRQSQATRTDAEFGFLAVMAGGRDDRAMVDAGGLFTQAVSIGLLRQIAAEPTVQEAMREPDKFSTIGRDETGELNPDSRHWHVYKAVCGFLEKSGAIMRSDSVADAMRILADKLHEQPTHEVAAGDNDEQTPAEPEYGFRPDGDGYDITFHESGHVSAFRCKGLHQIHRLIETPMVPVLMTELEGASFVDPHSHQEIADQATLKDVAAKLREAKSELERATASQDRDTIDVEHCRQEVEKWEDELGKLLGLRGQVRDLNNPYDKKRPKIWGTINTAKKRLRDFGHSELADHLDGSIDSERAWFVYVPKLNPIPNWKT